MPPVTKRGRSHALTGTHHIPRPPNSWILFRSSRAKRLRDEGITLPRNAASRMFAQEWRSFSAADKKPYEELAEQAKQEHERAYPEYRYRPLTKAMKARMRDEREVEDVGRNPEEGQGQRELGQGQDRSMFNAFDAGTLLGQPEPVLQTEHEIPFVPSNTPQSVVDANATFHGDATGQYNGWGGNALYHGTATGHGHYIPFNFFLPPVQEPNAFAEATVDVQQQLQALNNVFFGDAGGSSSSAGLGHNFSHQQPAQVSPLPLAYYDAQTLTQYNLAETPVEPLQIEVGQTVGPPEVFENFELWAWGVVGVGPGQGGGGGAALRGDLAEPSDALISTSSSSQMSTSPVDEEEFRQQRLHDISNVYDEGSSSESSASLPVHGVADCLFDGALDKPEDNGESFATEVGTPAVGFRFEDWVDL